MLEGKRECKRGKNYLHVHDLAISVFCLFEGSVYDFSSLVLNRKRTVHRSDGPACPHQPGKWRDLMSGLREAAAGAADITLVDVGFSGLCLSEPQFPSLKN